MLSVKIFSFNGFLTLTRIYLLLIKFYFLLKWIVDTMHDDGSERTVKFFVI